MYSNENTNKKHGNEQQIQTPLTPLELHVVLDRIEESIKSVVASIKTKTADNKET